MLAKQIVWMMTGAIVLTVAMVVSTVLWTARANNLGAAEDSHLMIHGGLAAFQERLSTLNWDYSNWTAALENSLARNTDWLTENMGSSAEGETFDVMQITLPKDGSHFVWSVYDEAEVSTDRFFSEELVREIHTALQRAELGQQDTITFGANVGGRMYFVSASRIQPWQQESPVPAEELPINFMAIELNTETLTAFGDTYLVDDLFLSREVGPGQMGQPLDGLNGKPIAFSHGPRRARATRSSVLQAYRWASQ
jgi:sensor domain CHASE-containing protein